jgi:hypothetical protein
MSTFTGKGIDVFRLTIAKHAVALEAKGIKMSRDANWTRVMRKELGLKPRAPHTEVIAAIEARLAEVLPQAHAEGGIQP